MHWQQSRPESEKERERQREGEGKRFPFHDLLWIFDWTEWVSQSESCCILAGVVSSIFVSLYEWNEPWHIIPLRASRPEDRRLLSQLLLVLSNSICPHFNFLSFYALLRIDVPRLVPSFQHPIIIIIKAQPQAPRICDLYAFAYW